MTITKEELKDLIEPKGDIEKISTISSDGKTFVTRIPKELVNELNINKGDKLMWVLNKKQNQISLSVSGAQIVHTKEKDN